MLNRVICGNRGEIIWFRREVVSTVPTACSIDASLWQTCSSRWHPEPSATARRPTDSILALTDPQYNDSTAATEESDLRVATV